ncbi:DUF2189 domain-containing protein [Oerskovia merdavium]|uniref:Integral membrane protein n=1 Tax=Oerskovia merdavium TaxID=2762227 RepID=A0ABR8TVB9_9CELL|nr:hypothetical protein [Oerskovia merdavium]MBD7979732.1 hypothetical protein [Oerskovia merdavium]
MSDNTAGGPPPEENEPTPQNPYASTPEPGAAPPPSEPEQPVTPPVTPPAQPATPPVTPPAQPTPPTAPPVTPPTAPPVAPPPYGAPTPPPAAPPYGAPAAPPYGAPAGGQPPVAPPPGGGYPPPGGGYPPPGGGYPPAGGAYPPPAQPAYVGAAPFAVGDAIGFGWKKFWANPLPWILAALIFVLINAVFNWITGGFERFTDYRTDGFTDTNMLEAVGLSFGSVVLSIVGAIIGYLITAFFTRGALDESQARKPDVAAFFRIGNVVNVILAAFLVGIMAAVGTILCVLPGLAVLLFSTFVYYFTLDKEQDAITAIKSSWSLVAKNFGSVFLLLLALFGINIVGFIACFIGLLVTIPLSYIAVAYAYRRLIGEQPV